MSERSNITLIGMPGAGKSTLGILLAKALAKNFLDTDILIQQQENCTLQDYQQQHGIDRFQEIEADVLINLKIQNCIIATGGSAVYSEQAMQALARHSRVVFIDVPLSVLSERIHNMESRGIVQKPGQDFATLYRERWPLYEQAADLRIRR